MTATMCGGYVAEKKRHARGDEEHRSPHVSPVTRFDDEENGPPEFMYHMWTRQRPPPS